MQSKLLLYRQDTDSTTTIDLDEQSGRHNGKGGVVEIGGVGSDIECLAEGVQKGHLRFEWYPQASTWRLTNQGADGTVFINKTKVSSKASKILAYNNCRIRCCGIELFFERSPSLPTFAEKSVERIPITSRGLIIGRGNANRGGEDTPRLCLDSEIRTISSKQAEIIKDGSSCIFLNHNADSGNRTKINGTQSLTRRELVFGDVIQIPGYDFYSFQFAGDSLIHVGGAGAIQARGLTRFARDGRKILADVNIDLGCGEFVGVLGGSGQGKSTLMKALCGVEPASKGGVWVEGVKIAGAAQMAEMRLGYVPQDDIVHKELSVRRALIYSTKLRVSLPTQQLNQALDTVLETLALTEHQHKSIRVLSGGQRKRVSIASELIMNPRFLFLDEPTSGLDPLTEWDLMADLFNLAKKRRMGILCTTHVLGRSNLFSGIVFVHGGRIIFNGRPIDAAKYFLIHSGGGRSSTDSTGSATSESTASSSKSSHSSSSQGSSDDVSESELLSNLPRVFREVAENVDRRLKELGEQQNGKKGSESVSEQVARELEDNYKESEFRVPLPPVEDQQSKSRQKGASKHKRPGFLRTLSVLFARQWRILRADPLNYLFLLAQAVIIGFLVGWVSESLAFQMFITVVATLWFGCSNGAQQIVGELAIYRRERLAGVGLNVYLVSKLLFLSLVTSAQALILFFTVLCTHHTFHFEISDEVDSYDPLYERKAFTALFFGHIPREEKEIKITKEKGSADFSHWLAGWQQQWLDEELPQIDVSNSDSNSKTEDPKKIDPSKEIVTEDERKNEEIRLHALKLHTDIRNDFETWIKKYHPTESVLVNDEIKIIKLKLPGESFSDETLTRRVKELQAVIDERRAAMSKLLGEFLSHNDGEKDSTDIAKLKVEFGEQFNSWIKENYPEKLIFAKPDSAIYVELLAKFMDPNFLPGNDEENVRPKWNPTGLSPGDKEYVMLERIAWFFRIKQNVLDKLGLKDSSKTQAQLVSWRKFIAILLGMRLAALLAASICGVSLGLMISASVRNETQAVMWVPLILIPQILFGGFVVTSPEMAKGVRLFSECLPSYNLQRLMDTANIYEREKPLMTNKTKIPAFLSSTPYSKNVVRWPEGETSQKLDRESFDKLSDVNQSWQNLTVIYDRVGMWHYDKKRDSIEDRRDVWLQQGNSYKDTNFAGSSWIILGGWFLGCYILVLRGLVSKQTGL